MNGETSRVDTSSEREKDRHRCLGLWALVGVLTVAGTALTLLIP